jgi:hypothetical protein
MSLSGGENKQIASGNMKLDGGWTVCRFNAGLVCLAYRRDLFSLSKKMEKENGKQSTPTPEKYAAGSYD